LLRLVIPGWDCDNFRGGVQQEATLLLQAPKPGDTIDGWGNLSKLHEVAFGESMGRLAESERAAGHEPWTREDLA
jgi:hypothetical protein